MTAGERFFLLGCGLAALLCARPFAGSWNDASRLATAECLAERGTLAIDDSIFVAVPPAGPRPFGSQKPRLNETGTLDKLKINGHYYSDKTPLPSVYLAGVYKLWLVCGGPRAGDRPDWFCRILTWASSGLAFVVAGWGVIVLGRVVGLSERSRIELGLAFAAGTHVLGYVGTVNAHVIQLAFATWLFVGLWKLPTAIRPVRLLAGIGTCAGLAYAADAAAGPTLCLATAVAAYGTTRRPMSWIVLGLATMPAVFAHHALNYAVGGTLAPANANAAYLTYDGSPFSGAEITGAWRHESPVHFVRYAFDLLIGKQGFLFHAPVLLLAIAGTFEALKLAGKGKWAVRAAVIWCLSTWLLAALTSSNRSGACLSIRWFMPLLAAGFLTLAILLKDRPDLRPDFRLLAWWGVPIAILSAIYGLWTPHMLPGYWGLVAGMLVSWTVLRYRMRLPRIDHDGATSTFPGSAKIAGTPPV
jgi:hypothetical protein